jgi:hypothetical protein
MDALRDRLKYKPEVHPQMGIKIMIREKPLTTIVVDRDDGEKAQNILEKIKRKKLSSVIHKINEKEPIQPKSVEIQAKSLKAKKIPTHIVLQDEDENIADANDAAAEDEQPIIIKRKTKQIKIPKGIAVLGPENMIQIGDTPLPARLPPIPQFQLRVSNYYMNNRELFVHFIDGLFEPYKNDLLDESKGISCDTIGQDTGKIELLTHQKIIRDYINLYTPYRGLLLYHGLGSGKTCSSIAIAEGFKNTCKVFVLTPASLKRNYMEEIKKCGDLLYRKNQYWEWVSTTENPTYVNALSASMGISVEYIKRHRGAWLVNIQKPSNYNELTAVDKKTLNDQLDEMIEQKYTFINYNGLRRDKFQNMTSNFTKNIFDNSVIIIDEAHNLISRIVNKINKMRKYNERIKGPNALIPQSLALIMYEFLMSAENCRIIPLTGTPVINYPNEIAILYNILRGYIKTWTFTLSTDSNQKISKENLKEIFSKEKSLDYMDFIPSSKTFTITRNPFGFETKLTQTGYKGVTNEKKEKRNVNGNVERDEKGNIIYNERGQLSDSEFVKRIIKILQKHDIKAVQTSTPYAVHTALPDTLDEFVNNFINPETGNMINVEKFKRRIIGLTSYFRSAQEELMPKYDKEFNKHIITIPMSDYQFGVYENYRVEERKTEKNSNKKNSDIFKESSSTYRIFSRLACNFVMPVPPGRPVPANYRIQNKDKDEDNGDKNIIQVNAQEKEPQAKPLNKVQEKEPQAKPLNKAQAKAQEKEAKAQAKAQEKEAKAQAKAKEKEAKAQEKEAKAQAKAKEKEAKALEKKAKKMKGGFDSDSDLEENNSESDSDSDSDSEKEMLGGDPAESFLEQIGDERVALEDYKDDDAQQREVEELEGDELLEKMGSTEYKNAVKHAMQYLQLNGSKYLTESGLETYSPKFLAMLDNIQNPEHGGLHLIYSQFRTMEGIGIFSLVLEANGFAKFKIKRDGINNWQLDMSEVDLGKPCYALYTGTEDAEEREILRNIYNGAWNYIPNNIANQLKAKSSNNDLGEIVKILMITSAGSEGINLRNTRFVHIMEPYWHPVRIEQVIGRARRICSHQSLPKELQSVDVFIYIMTFTKEQMESDDSKELRLKDLSKNAPYLPQTSDEKLLEISTIKENVNSQLLKASKETTIDCGTHVKSNNKEGLVCLTFGKPTADDFTFRPDYKQDENDTFANMNKVTIHWEAREFKLKSTGKKYILRVDTNQVYDYDSVIRAKEIPGVHPILLGKLVKNERGEYQIIKNY